MSIADFLEGLESKDRSALMRGAIVREALKRMEDDEQDPDPTTEED